MICYNVYVKLSNEMDEKEWRTYMINEHIPNVMKTECFIECKMMKEAENDQWHIQYFLENEMKMEEYQTKFASQLKQEVIEKYNGSFEATRTITKVIHSF